MLKTLHHIFSKYIVSLLLIALLPIPSQAALNIDITRGVVRAIPIAVVPFVSTGVLATDPDIAAIIGNDLNRSGQFDLLERQAINQFPDNISKVKRQYWRQKGVDSIVIGDVRKLDKDRYQVHFSLVDLFKLGDHLQSTHKDASLLLNETYTVSQHKLRGLAHHMSDEIYQKLVGDRGVFSTRLAYVSVQKLFHKKKLYQLMIADSDGENAHAILTSQQPIMSPSWSPDGHHIAYVTFETTLPQIYISDIATGKRHLLSSFPGINGAPAWSPNGKKLAVALSMDNTNPNIYVINIANKQLQQITNNWAINTEPSWSPDGDTIIFTSDRGGAPQIYAYNFTRNKVQRMTYTGGYNASASYSPDGKRLIMLHKDETGYNIASMDLSSGIVKILTPSGNTDSPSVAPNGKMIVYATHDEKKGVLGMVSDNGQIILTLPEQQADVQEPAWSPYLG